MELETPLNKAHFLVREAERLLKKGKFEEAVKQQDKIVTLLEAAKAESRDNKVTESIELQIKHHIRQKVVIAQRQSRCEKYTKDLKNLQLKMAKANLLDAGLQVDIQGAFFNCSHPKISKCQPVSKLTPQKLEYQNCSHPKKNKERKKLKYPNCSHPKKTKREKS